MNTMGIFSENKPGTGFVRKLFVITTLALLATIPISANIKSGKDKEDLKERLLPVITQDAAKAHVGFLASDALEGRRTGHKGAEVARQYIISQLRQWGIAPADSSYMQPSFAYSEDRQRRKRYQINPDSVAKLVQGIHRKLNLANVVSMIKGKNGNEYVVVGAHFDHEGTDPELSGDKIYNGADDNASGVSAVLQLAKTLSAADVEPECNIVFAFWDGEEHGLLGSRYFVSQCPYIKNIKCYINFDMVGRDKNPDKPRHVVYFYTASHPEFGRWMKDGITRHDLALEPEYKPWDNPVGGSDNGSFARVGVPIIWFHTDGHPDYHKPSDEASRINYPKLTEITRAALIDVIELAY